jgi:hypothetical protein
VRLILRRSHWWSFIGLHEKDDPNNCPRCRHTKLRHWMPEHVGLCTSSAATHHGDEAAGQESLISFSSIDLEECLLWCESVKNYCTSQLFFPLQALRPLVLASRQVGVGLTLGCPRRCTSCGTRDTLLLTSAPIH